MMIRSLLGRLCERSNREEVRKVRGWDDAGRRGSRLVRGLRESKVTAKDPGRERKKESGEATLVRRRGGRCGGRGGGQDNQE